MIDYLLIDGGNLIHRCFWALKGNNFDEPELEAVENAAYGMVARLSSEWHVGPSRTIAAFDAGDGGRKALYPAYKANRNHTSPVLKAALEKVPFQLMLRGVRPIAKEGWEADDVLATLASLAEDVRREVVIATGDKDLLQCLMPDVQLASESQRQVLLFGGHNIPARCYGVQDFEERYMFSPSCWTTYNALVGEKGDNIPGVPGIGEKKATALIREFGNLDHIFGCINGPRPKGILTKDVTSLLDHYDQAFVSLQLCTLNRRVPGVCLEHE